MTDYEIEQELIKEGITDKVRIDATIKHIRKVGLVPEVFFRLPGEIPDFTKEDKPKLEIEEPEPPGLYELTPEEEEEMREAEELRKRLNKIRLGLKTCQRI